MTVGHTIIAHREMSTSEITINLISFHFIHIGLLRAPGKCIMGYFLPYPNGIKSSNLNVINEQPLIVLLIDLYHTSFCMYSEFTSVSQAEQI